MIKKRILSLAAVLAFFAGLDGVLGEVGDPAPPLAVKEWLTSKPAGLTVGTNFFKASTNLYVVELFTTSTYGSLAAITNLTRLQARYRDKGVVVVGICNDALDKVRQFIQVGGTNLQYAVGLDDERQTTTAYLASVRHREPPCAFLVGKDGIVLWHGDPRQGLNNTVAAVLAGTYDLKWIRKAEAARVQMQQYLGLVKRRDPRAGSAGRVVLAARTNDVALLCDLAWEISALPHAAKREVALANEALDQAQKLAGTNATQITTTRAVLLFETGQRAEGLAGARQAVAEAKNPQDKLNAQACLRRMEARMKAATTHQAPAALTNQSQLGLTNQLKAGVTNEPPNSPDKP